MSGLVAAEELASPTALDCDVVVVGSGAGGAAAACRLAEAGHTVVVLEEGGVLPPPGVRPRRFFDALSSLYRDGGVTPILGRPPIVFQEGRCVGGGTVVNGGMAWRTPPEVMRRWREDHGLAFLTESGTEPYFRWVEAGNHVAPQAEGTISEAEGRFCAAARELGMHPTPNLRVQRDCRGSGVCILGCPEDRKMGAHVTFIPRALAAGATVVSHVRVDRIDTRGGRASGVSGTSTGPDGRRFCVRSRAVVVSAGAMHTPALLASSGLARPGLGASLRLHPSAKAVGVLADEVRQWAGVHQGHQVHDHLHRGLLLAAVGLPPPALALSLPGIHRDSAELMGAYDRMLVGAALMEDTTTGRVLRTPSGQPWAWYRVNRAGVERFREGMTLVAHILFQAGARSVHLPVRGLSALTGPGDVERLAHARLAPADLELVSVHAMGTCAMGSSPHRHPVAPDGSYRGTPGLWVADASLFPDSLGVNPQITIQLLATWVADAVSEALTR